jgi:hypothetical protein
MILFLELTMSLPLKPITQNYGNWIASVLILLVLLAAFVTACLGSISYMSSTEDEPRHLIRGIMLLETGDYRLNRHHPPFANVMNALPLLFIGDLRLPSTRSEAWERADTEGLAKTLYSLNGDHRHVTAHILNPARFVTVAFAAMTLAILFIVIKSDWGIVAASTFLFLCTLEPNMIAHSSLVTTDAWVALLIFATTYALYRYAKTLKKSHLGAFLILSFISLLTKYSSIPVAFLWLVLLAVIRIKNTSAAYPFMKRFIHAARLSLGVAFTWTLLLSAAYGFRFKPMAEISHADAARTEVHLQKIAAVTDGNVWLTKALQNGYRYLPLPFPEYILGFFGNVVIHDTYGHQSYLFGMRSIKGWWYYFPLAMLVKMPVPILVAIGALLAYFFVCAMRRITALHKSKQRIWILLGFHPEYVLLCVPLFFFTLSMKSSINIGIRHVLPVFPFISLAIGILLSKYWNLNGYARIPAVMVGIWLSLSSSGIYPYYLEYFNELAGGPSNGYKYLLGSNLNWGQDEFLVQDYIRNLPEGTLTYINPLHEVQKGVVVIEVGLLMGNSDKHRPQTAWLRDRFLAGEIKPKHRIAYTHMVFEF